MKKRAENKGESIIPWSKNSKPDNGLKLVDQDVAFGFLWSREVECAYSFADEIPRFKHKGRMTPQP